MDTERLVWLSLSLSSSLPPSLPLPFPLSLSRTILIKLLCRGSIGFWKVHDFSLSHSLSLSFHNIPGLVELRREEYNGYRKVGLGLSLSSSLPPSLPLPFPLSLSRTILIKLLCRGSIGFWKVHDLYSLGQFLIEVLSHENSPST